MWNLFKVNIKDTITNDVIDIAFPLLNLNGVSWSEDNAVFQMLGFVLDGYIFWPSRRFVVHILHPGIVCS